MKDGYMLRHGRALEQGSDDLPFYKNAYLYPNLWAVHRIPKGIAGKHCCNGNKDHDNESQFLLNAHFRLSVA